MISLNERPTAASQVHNVRTRRLQPQPFRTRVLAINNADLKAEADGERRLASLQSAKTSKTTV